jgi:hypothetical protein
MEFDGSIDIKDIITVGGVIFTCIWSVVKIRTAIDGVKLTAEKTAALLGKDIQHLSLTIGEFKSELLHVKKEQVDIDRRVARLEVVQDSNNNGAK